MIHWVKEHKWLTGGLVLGAVVLYYLWKNRSSIGSSSSSAAAGVPVGGGYYPSYSGSGGGGGAGIATSSPAPTSQATVQLPPTGSDIGAATVHASDAIVAHDVPLAAHTGPTDYGNHPGGICTEGTWGVVTGCTPPWAQADIITGASAHWTPEQSAAVAASQGNQDAVKAAIAGGTASGTTLPVLSSLFGGKVFTQAESLLPPVIPQTQHSLNT